MLIASHAFFATLPALFSAAGWQQPADSSFGTTDINAVMADGDLSYVAVGNEGKIGLSSNSGFTWSQVDSPFWAVISLQHTTQIIYLLPEVAPEKLLHLQMGCPGLYAL